MAVTLRDIAESLGISTQAVSMALRERPGTARVSPALRERVVAAAAEMGYRSNRLARGLASGRSRTLGLLLLHDHYPLFAPAAKGIEAAATAAGFGLLLCTADRLPDGSRRHSEFFAESRVEGIVAIAPSRVGRIAEILEAKPPGVPLISINREVSHPEVHSILMAHRAAARRVTEHLLGRGYPTVAFLDIPTSHPLQSSRDMLAGYHDAMQAAALTPLVASLPTGWRDRLAEAKAATHALLEAHPPPLAIFAVTDYEAVGALHACLERGLRVPDDVALFGYDDMEIAAYATVAISSVHQPFDDAGKQAVAMLLDWGQSGTAGTTYLDCELILRESSDGRDRPAAG